MRVASSTPLLLLFANCMGSSKASTLLITNNLIILSKHFISWDVRTTGRKYFWQLFLLGNRSGFLPVHGYFLKIQGGLKIYNVKYYKVGLRMTSQIVPLTPSGPGLFLMCISDKGASGKSTHIILSLLI